MITLELREDQAGRVVAALKQRQRKLEKGINKFSDNFDPEKGANMVEALEAHNELISYIEEKIDA